MKLSEGIEWAIHCCSLLAVLPAGSALPGAKLAEFFDVPRDYLAKHMQKLSNASIVASTRGPKGGYRLAKSPSEISLLHIVEAIDGKDPCFKCTEIRQQGPSALSAEHYKRPCGIARAMHQAESVWRRELAKVSLESLVLEAQVNVNPKQIQKSTEWLELTLGLSNINLSKD